MKQVFIYFLIFLSFLFISTKAISKNTYFNDGEKLFNNKKYSESKLKFEKDIVFNPESEKSYLYLAKIFNKKNNIILAEQNLNTVILLNPKNEEAIYLLTLLKIKQSNYSESEKLIKNFKKVCINLCKKEEELIKKFSNIQTN